MHWIHVESYRIVTIENSGDDIPGDLFQALISPDVDCPIPGSGSHLVDGVTRRRFETEPRPAPANIPGHVDISASAVGLGTFDMAWFANFRGGPDGGNIATWSLRSIGV